MKKFPVFRSGMSAVVMVALFVGVIPIPAAAVLPSGFEFETVVEGLNLPTTAAFAPDGRIFVAEKDGTVRVVKNGVLLPVPLVRLSDVNAYGDRGLIGMAVDPNFFSNGYLYLSYTYENTPGADFAGVKTGRIVRVTVDGDSADEATKVVLVGSEGGNIATPSCDDFPVGTDCIPSDAPSHSVGGLRFGPDGKLYATLGDGAHFDYLDPRMLRAQNIDSLAGKMLRINTDGTAPSDNPFYNGDPNANRSKVYVYGVRNMFRFNFRPGIGTLYGGDVGWNLWEEINIVTPGANFGWPCREGTGPTEGGFSECDAPGAIDPVYTYRHDSTTGAGSITSGAFPANAAYPPEFDNSFFFGDYAQNWIKRAEFSGGNVFLGVNDFGFGDDGTNGPVEFITGPDGNIYFLAIYTGALVRITHTSGNRRPIVSIAADPTSGLTPLEVSFSSAGSFDPDGDAITLQWDFGDGAGATTPNPTHVYAENDDYTATLTVRDVNGAEVTKSIRIAAGNQAPSARILSPASGLLYTPGQSIEIHGEGIDPEEGALTGAALTWRIIEHHNVHTHLLETGTGEHIVMTAPDHTDPGVFVEVELTARDSTGLSRKASINLYYNNGVSVSGNLIRNPSLEESDPVQSLLPRYWSGDWWGVNNSVFTYPVTGFEGENLRGARVEMQSYASGDAKWAFDPVFADENKEYVFTDYYTASVPTRIVAQIGYSDATYSYIEFGVVPGSESWVKVTKTFTTPPGTRTLRVFHIIDRVGVLTVDNFGLVLSDVSDTTPPEVAITSPGEGATIFGTVTLTASASDNVGIEGVEFSVDDISVGVEDATAPYEMTLDTTTLSDGAHTIAAHAHDTSGNMAVSSEISVTIANAPPPPPPDGNLVPNPSLEDGGIDPTSWHRGN